MTEQTTTTTAVVDWLDLEEDGPCPHGLPAEDRWTCIPCREADYAAADTASPAERSELRELTTIYCIQTGIRWPAAGAFVAWLLAEFDFPGCLDEVHFDREYERWATTAPPDDTADGEGDDAEGAEEGDAGGPATAAEDPRWRKGDLVVWEQEISSAALGGGTCPDYQAGTVAHASRGGRVMAIANASGIVVWRASWSSSSRPRILRWWLWSEGWVDVAGVLAAHCARRERGRLETLEELREVLRPFVAA